MKKFFPFLLFSLLLMSAAPIKKNISLTYIVTTTDTSFYTNQPIYFRASVCDKRIQLCTELGKSDTYTYTGGTQKALSIALSTQITKKDLTQILNKRRIHIDDAKIKLEVHYARNDVFSRFVEKTIEYKKLLAAPEELGLFLKEYFDQKTGLVESSHLKIQH